MPVWSANRFIRTPLALLGVIEIGVPFASVYLAGIIIFGDVQAAQEILGPLWTRATVISIATMCGLVAVGLYQLHQRLYYREVAVRVSVAIFGAGFVLAAVVYFLPLFNLPLHMAATASIVSLAILLALRFGFVRIVDENFFRRRTLVFGTGERAAEISRLRRKADRRGFKLVGRIVAPGDSETGDTDIPIPHDRTLVEIARETDAEEIVIAMDDRRGNLPVRELLDCKLRGIDVIELVDFLERETGTIRIDVVNPGWLIFTPGFRINQVREFTKRLMDIVLSLIVFLLSWPVMMLVAAGIKLTEGPAASIIYRQRRVGLHGDTFDVLKFRSMREDAEQDGQAVWAKQDDDRVTRVGKFIRKVRFDELPQVFNVLKGEMSLVGPRPERPEFVEKLAENIPYYIERHTVKPGVTGWAQLRYAYGSSEEDAAHKLQYDLYYVKNHGFILDLIILLQTVEVVLWGKGAR